jgi:hypothetical protein
VSIDRIEVVCDGPPDMSHQRTVIRRYVRLPVEPPEWWWLPATDRRPLDALDAGDWPVHGQRIRLRCRDCRLDEKRRLDRDYGRDYPPFSAVFEKLRANGVQEVSVQALVRRVWPTP